jgi:uncharacterized membrane protein YhaH (DUF805 family)
MQNSISPANAIPGLYQPETYSLQSPNSPSDPITQTGMFKGRLNRIGFLLSFVYVLIYFLIPLPFIFLLKGNPVANIVVILLGVVGVGLVITIGISIAARRWHDLNQSGRMVLLGSFPLVGFILLFLYLLVSGTKTTNNYGMIDNRPSTFRKVLFGK